MFLPACIVPRFNLVKHSNSCITPLILCCDGPPVAVARAHHFMQCPDRMNKLSFFAMQDAPRLLTVHSQSAHFAAA